MKISASIVLYNNPPEQVQAAIQSCLASSLVGLIYLIDNSEKDELAYLANHSRVQYRHNEQNMGFGAAHNQAISSMAGQSDVHLVLNPDISFQSGVLETLFAFMDAHPDVGLLMPKVYYQNGHIQRLCKLLPTPFDLFGRRFAGSNKWVQQRNRNYELANFSYNQVADIPNLSGCFMFIRNKILQQVGLFDERFFLYLEDVDLVRRIGRVARTVYYPYVHIIHGYQQGSYRNSTHLKYHIQSAIQYFNKWGWFFDQERVERNRHTLNNLLGKS